MVKRYKKPNWQWVQIGERDIRLFKTILEQKSLRRTEVIEHIFDGKSFYAELRLRKLKKFGYLTQDSRIKERRKYGLKKARKAPQWAKR